MNEKIELLKEIWDELYKPVNACPNVRLCDVLYLFVDKTYKTICPDHFLSDKERWVLTYLLINGSCSLADLEMSYRDVFVPYYTQKNMRKYDELCKKETCKLRELINKMIDKELLGKTKNESDWEIIFIKNRDILSTL